MANLEESIDNMLAIDGAKGAALLDVNSGMALALGARGLPEQAVELVAASTIDLVRGYNKVAEMAGEPGSQVENVVAQYPRTLGFVRILDGENRGLAMLLMLDRASGNQALAAHKLQLIESTLVV